jgi:O-antigen ligase
MQKLLKYIYNINFYIVLFLPVIFILRSFTLNFLIGFVVISYIIYCFIKKELSFFKEISVLSVILLFIFIIINSLFAYNLIDYNKNIEDIFGLLALLRFPIFSIAVFWVLSKINKSQIKIIKLSYLIIFLLVCLDIGIQYIFRKDIFGFVPGMCSKFDCERYSGPFGEELIAGTYLYIFGSVVIILLLDKKMIISLFILIINLFFTLLTGDRSPFLGLLIFVFIGLFFFKIKKNLKFFITIFLCVMLSLSIDRFSHLKDRYYNFSKYSFFQNKSSEVFKSNNKKNAILEKVQENPWGKHYILAFKIFKDNPFFGTGYKTFRTVCKKYTDPNFEESLYKSCSTHPHNFYLEIISEQGLIGISLFLIFLSIIFYNLKFCYKHKNLLQKKKFILITILFLSIYFPFKPSGSFYTTWNTSLIFFCYGFYLYYLNIIKRR